MESLIVTFTLITWLLFGYYLFEVFLYWTKVEATTFASLGAKTPGRIAGMCMGIAYFLVFFAIWAIRADEPFIAVLLISVMLVMLLISAYLIYRVFTMDKFTRWFGERGALISNLASVKSELSEQRRERRRFEALFNSSPGGFARIGLNGFLTDWSPGATSILGWTMKDLSGVDIENTPVAKGVEQEILSLPENLDKGAEFHSFQAWLPTKNGEKRFCLVNVAPVMSAMGRKKEVISYVANITDLTETEQTKEALVASKEALREANTGLERMVRLATHDLQEPLRIIVTYLDLLIESIEEGETDKSEILKYTTVVQQAAYGQRRLINTLMHLYQFREGAHDFKKFNISVAIGQALESLSVPIEDAKAVVVVDADLAVEADLAGCTQLLINLIGNSVKYRKKNEAPVIHVAAKRSSSGVTLTVKDNGLGVPDWFMDDIGQPFKRAFKRSEYDGTGLGLSVVKQVADMFSGVLAFKNNEEGLTVTVSDMKI